MASVPVLAARLGARVFLRAMRAPAKYGHVKRETGSEKGKGRGGACFSFVRYASFADQDFK